MTEYVNKDYYKSLAVTDRFYINPGNNTRAFMDRLSAEGIAFSATLGDYKQTVTVSKADREKAEGILYSLNAAQAVPTAQNRTNPNIIGNAEYNSITNKRYIKTDAETARSIAQNLANGGSIQFSGIIRGNTATITVSGDENAAAVRSMIDNMKYGVLLAELDSAGFERVTNGSFFKDGFIVLRNKATGEQCGFDGFDMIRSMWEDPDNEYFHPPVYKIVRDEEKHDYYISERYADNDTEKDVYYESNGNVPTFDSVDAAINYVRRNNVAVINTAEELETLRTEDMTRQEMERAASNAKLISQFPMDNGMYPDDFMFFPENGKYDWYYFNPDGDDGRGVFNYARLTDEDIYNAYKAYTAEEDKEKGRQAFFSYLYNYANTEIIDTRSEMFAACAGDYIRKPTMTERYYGLLENGGNETEIDRFIHINELRNKLIQADYDRTAALFLEDIDLRTANADLRSEYRRSMESCSRCAEAIADAIHNYYGFTNENSLDTELALEDVMKRFTPERVAYVLSIAINDRGEFDKRITGKNTEWAKELLKNLPDLYTSLSNRSVLAIRSQLGETHTGLINLLVDDFEKHYFHERALVSDKDVSDISEESISDRVTREYNTFVDGLRKESVDVIIQSAYEISEKEKIKQYFEDYFDENSFWEKDLEVLRNAPHLLEDVYRVWTDMPNLTSMEDVREAITAGIEYGKIRYTKPAIEEKTEEPQMPLAEQVTKRLQDELETFNTEMVTLDPATIMSRITEISAKREIAEYDVTGAMELDSSRLSALLTSKNILDEVYQEWLSLDTNGLQDIGLAFEECAGSIMESLKREQEETFESEIQEEVSEPTGTEQDEIPVPETVEEPHDRQYYLNLAKKYINDFCDKEYGNTGDFSNINEVGIGYTTVTDEEIPLQINADLENYQIKYYLKERLYKTEDYDSLQAMVENVLSVLDFNEMVYTVESDPDEVIQAFVDVDTNISVPEQGISFDIAAVDEFVITGAYSEYMGGMDENGHEAKDNYQHYDTSLSLRLEGAKVISEIYDERDEWSPYTEDIFDLLTEGGRDALIKHINDFANDNDVREIYTLKNGEKKTVELTAPETKQEVIKTEPPFGTKNEFTALVAPPPSSLDYILRCGSNEADSIERIVAHFLKGKTIEENAAFLRDEFGRGGKGYVIGDDTVSAWFDKEGITFAAGETAFPVGFSSFVTWEDAASRLETLLEKGQYCSQEILDSAPEHDRKNIADEIWYLHQDLSENVGFFLPEDYFRGGFPDNTDKISEQLKNYAFQKNVEEGLSDFAERYAQDKDILRFNYHDPAKLLSRVLDLMGTHKDYKADDGFEAKMGFFFTEDEKDELLLHGSGMEMGKFRIEEFFKDDHTEKEKADFLKDEYGTGGRGTRGIDEWHDSKGISYKKSLFNTIDTEYTMKWNEAAKRITRLISEGKYITSEDIEERKRRIAWDNEHGTVAVKTAFVPTFDIYQVKQGTEYRDVRYLTLGELERLGKSLDKGNYERVYHGNLSMIEGENKPEGIFEYFNLHDHPETYTGTSPNIGDVFVLNNEDGSEAVYANRAGFVDVSDIFVDKERHRKPDDRDTELMALAEKIAADIRDISGQHHDDNFDLYKVHNNIKWNDWNDDIGVYQNTIDALFAGNFYSITAYAVNVMGFSDNEQQAQKAKEALELTKQFKDMSEQEYAVEDKTPDISETETKEKNTDSIILEGYSDTYSVINTMEYGGKALLLLENDELGDEAPYIIIDSDRNVLSDRAHSFEDFTSVYTESEVALGILAPDKTICFTVAEFDDGTETVVYDGRYGIDDIQETSEYLDYYDKTEYDDIKVHLEQYMIGYGEPSDTLTDAQADYIKAHILAVKKDSSLLESISETLHHEYYSDIVKDMGLQHSNITFAVVKFDDDKTVIMDSVPDENDIYDMDEFMDYVANTGKTRVEVSYEYYTLGDDVESDYASKDQKEYILENLEDVTAEATMLEDGSFRALAPEQEIEEYDNDEPEMTEEEEIIESEPDKKEQLSISPGELSVGDMFMLHGKEYTIVDMQGIYPDDVVISKTESMGDRDFSVTENYDKFRLIREGEYLGNPQKAAQRQEVYTPHIGDIIELDGSNLYEIEDISGDEITFREMDTLFADTLKMPLADLYTHDFEVVNENEYYRKQDDYILEEDIEPVSSDKTEETEVQDEDISDDISEKSEKSSEKTQNYVITDENIGVATPKVRYADNINAIVTLKEIEIGNRTATPEEQEILSKYTGWGAIPQVFDSSNEKWKDEYTELLGILTDEEYAAARKSTMNAHYTSPTVINAIYKGLENMGFKVGKILEPAVGVGNFFGRLPETMGASHLTGVELDSITGRIAKQLYPNADIRIQGFEETSFADNSFDIAVGNVPFGDYKLNDKRYNDNNFLIHDYFFGKALDKVRPGGVIAFVTSKGTLDKENPKVREYIAQRAELLGAIRLPNTAFKANAGTEVTSDIIFLQKREFPIEVDMTKEPWIGKSEGKDGIMVNNYFVDHPEMILGTMTDGGGQFGTETQCVPIEGADLKAQLETAIANIKGEYKPLSRKKSEEVVDELPAPLNARKFSFYEANGSLYYLDDTDTMKRFTAKGDIEKRALGMIGIRDTLRELLDLQLNNADGTLDGEIAEKRKELNEIYDNFVAKYGHVNDIKNAKAFKGDDGYYLVAGLELKDEKGEISGKADIFTKNTVKPKIITNHVETAQEALILSVSEKAKVDFDYMTDLTGMGKDKLIDELKGQIFRLPKEEEEYVTADEYLTGNIRKKIQALDYAPAGMDVSEHRKALEAAMPPRVEAKDIAVRLGAHWVDPMYIQQFILEHFNPDYKSKYEMNVQYSKTMGTWKIEGVSQAAKKNYTATNQYGTKRMHAYAILEGILNNSSLQVKDRKLDEYGNEMRDEKGNYILVVNDEETKAVNIVAKQIKADFEDWIFKDPVRREALVDKYNEVYNSIRLREYDGSHLNFVGMNPDITLKEHQKNAIARALYGGNTLLAHAVGAGKSYEMIAIAMEGKRLGLHSKSLFAVPNSLTEQMGQEFLRLYPGANILVATKKDFETKNRKNLLAKIAANDYDAVILGHSQFDRMSLSNERQKTYLRSEIELLRDELEAAIDENGDRSFTVKQIEKSIASYEDRLKKLEEKQDKDDFVDFEQLGFSHMFVDESHLYKNLALASKMHNVAGLGSRGSARAFNLLMKSKYMDELTGGKGQTYASGTCISNSMVELYTNMRYLQAGLLKDVGIQHFDEWAADFGEVVTDYELKPESDGQYQLKSRFAKFTNLPELMSLFKECADIRTADTLDLEKPESIVQEVVAKPTKIQKRAIKALGKRASKIRTGSVDPREDNMLKITGDGKKIGLDQRLLDPSFPDEPNSKVNMCVRNVFDIYEQTKPQRSTQLIFCDMSTPKPESRQDCFYVYRKNISKPLGYEVIRKKVGIKPEFGFDDVKKHIKENAQEENDKLKNGDIVVIRRPSEDMETIISQAAVYIDGVLIPDNARLEELEMSEIQDMPPKGFNVYDDIKDKLIAKGVPADEIAFIHDYDTAEKKQKLFDKMNSGEVRVLLGSTAKCGAGMNVQKKLIALHHLDAPVRPSDMSQRNGRIERQGNENPQVNIFRYVTDQSFDAYIYQLLENKQRFISQILTSKTPERTCSDIDEAALDYAEVKALCAGNPLIKREMDLQGKIKDLKMEKSRYSEKIYELQDNIRVKYPNQIQLLTTNIEKSQKDSVTANQGAPTLRIGGVSYDMNDPDTKKTGAEALKAALNDPKNTSEAVSRQVCIGEYRGMKLSMLFDDLLKGWKGCLEGIKPHYFDWNINTDVGNITRMDNCIKHIDEEIAKSREKLDTMNSELAQMKVDVEKPFAKAEELRAAETELDEVHIELTKFTLTDDSMNKEIFERLVDTFEPILTGEKTYQKYKAEGFEPLCVEMEGHILTVAHSYVQNGDLMWDPRIDFNIDYENKKATPVSYEMSSLGVYEEYDIKNLTPEIAEKLNELLDFTDTWLDNIESQGYKPVRENEIEHSRDAVTAR